MELKDDHNSHYSPHRIIVSNFFIESVNEVDKRNQNQSNSNFDGVNSFSYGIPIFLDIRNNRT